VLQTTTAKLYDATQPNANTGRAATEQHRRGLLDSSGGS